MVPSENETLVPELAASVGDRLGEIQGISGERRSILDDFADVIARRVRAGDPVRLTFICTHNSRRSHMSQLWAQAAASIFSVPGVETFSGGTEATAFNPRAAAALRRAGFIIEPFTDGKNPVYDVRFSPAMEPIQVFSKIYDAAPNPGGGYIAIMTCLSADAACPVVDGADERIAIPYDDPNAFDGAEDEAEIYDERCAQIAREMLYVFSEVARRT